MSFADLGLSPKLLKAIEDSGYTEPTPIQAAAIPHALKGRDILGVAQTGTGKTASFTLPMIEMLSRGRAKARMPRTLILEPTRELAAQVAENFEKYGKYHKLTMALLIGGVSFGDQDRKLTQGVDVLIATPGRLLDHFERGKLLMSGVQILVIDEADRMLDMGFIPDIERIFKLTPFTRQTLFFSATMPTEIQRLTEQFLHNPEKIEVARQATAASTVTQRIIRVADKDPKAKRAALRAAIDSSNVRSAIVFCNRKRDVDTLARSLQRHKYKAAPIHGDLPQSVRTATLARFKDGDVTLLIASDVAARGLDIPDVSHVFNFDIPRHPEDYIHRIGRTGRAGKKGDAISIIGPEDRKNLAAVENLLGAKLEEVAAAKSNASTSSGSASSGSESTDQDAPRDPAPKAADPRKSNDAKAPRSRRSTRGRRSKSDDVAKTVDADAPIAAQDASEPSAPASAPSEPKTDAPAETATVTPTDTPAEPASRSNAEKPRRRRRKSAPDSERGGERASERGAAAASKSSDNAGGSGSSGGNDRPKREQKGRGRETVEIGLGDHTPAFLLRSPNPK